MNKKSILLGIVIIIVTCLTTGCIFYNYLEPKDFKEQFSARGYTVEKIEKADYDAEYISKATKEDVPYEVLYYEFATESCFACGQGQQTPFIPYHGFVQPCFLISQNVHPGFPSPHIIIGNKVVVAAPPVASSACGHPSL